MPTHSWKLETTSRVQLTHPYPHRIPAAPSFLECWVLPSSDLPAMFYPFSQGTASSISSLLCFSWSQLNPAPYLRSPTPGSSFKSSIFTFPENSPQGQKLSNFTSHLRVSVLHRHPGPDSHLFLTELLQ